MSNSKLPAAKWGEFNDLTAFEQAALQDGCFSVLRDEGQFDCYLVQKSVPRLFVLLSGARDPATMPLPKFDRWSWDGMFPGSVLCVSDPTLRLDPAGLNIGWYVGTKEHDWLKALADIVLALARRLGVASDQIICYGSSAGGFGAMMLAAELKNATAVAINPQTRIAKYSARFVKRFLDVAFGGRDYDELDVAEKRRMSVLDKFRDAPDVRCLIVQNVLDKTHYSSHFMDFCAAFDVPVDGGPSPTGNIVSMTFESELGHGPEPKDLAPALIERGVALSLEGRQANGTAGGAANEAQATPAPAATVRRLRLAKEPVWIDTGRDKSVVLEVQGSVGGWPADVRGAALMLLELGGEVAEDILKRRGISLSAKIGPFVYLDNFIKDGILRLKLQMPKNSLRRIGFRLWKGEHDIVIDHLRVTINGNPVDFGTAARGIDIFKEAQGSIDDLLAVDLLLHDAACCPTCFEKCQRWYASMDGYNSKSSSDLGRTDCLVDVGGNEFAAVTAFHGRPAMLHIPAAIDTYFERIGDKSRNMVRKASRAGYQYVVADPNDHIDEIVEIRTSAPLRQGKAIPAGFYVRPERIFDASTCKLHGDCFYGVFKDGKLVAYLTLYLFGQLAQVNHLLGHADHMKDGIMNLLMYEAVNDIIKNRPWIRAINYLYPGNPNAASGTPLFKRSMGFEPWRLTMAHGDPQLASVLDERRAQLQAERASAQAVVESKPVAKLDSTELGESLFVTTTASRDSGVAALLATLGPDNGAPRRLAYSADTQACADPALAEATVIVVDGVDAANVTAFLSAGFKQFKTSIGKNAFVLFDFPSDLEACDAGSSAPSAVEGTPDPLQKTKDYFLRRFKSTRPDADAIRAGFKGSDFVLRGIADYAGDAGPGACSVLLLKKIR